MANFQRKGTVSFVISLVVMLVPIAALAGTKYSSKEGSLTVQYDQCSTVEPSGSYQLQNGVSGELIALDCSRTGGDVAHHRFQDTTGNERCYGKMTQVWGRKVVTIWEVEGAVEGYSCSQIGEKYEIEMDSGQLQ